jgi:trigger factor
MEKSMGVQLPLYPRNYCIRTDVQERMTFQGMEVAITDISEVEKKIQIQATAEELVPHFEKAYREFQKKSEIPGFRKGKTPLEMVKKVYGEGIEYNSLQDVASTLYRQAVDERGIRPIGEPTMTDINYKRGETLDFTIRYEIKPAVTLNEYKNISVEKVLHTVNDEEIASEILRLRKSNSTLEPAETAADDESMVTADVQNLDETGTPLIGRKTSDMRIYLADENLVPEIRQVLRNARAGSVHRVTLQRERGERTETEDVEITVKKVEKVILPEFDNEFVKKITKEKVASVEDFRKKLRDDLGHYWKDRSERRLMDTIIAEIVRRHDITVPESLISGILNSLEEDLKNRSPNKTLPVDFNEKEFRENNRGYAIFQAKWFLLREEIIRAEGISVMDADLEVLAARDSQKVGIDKDRLVQFYKTSESVKDRILNDKLMAFLREHERVTEKTTEEFID